jgi:glycosyltransferase involved in cell wall biosynthesis
MTLVYDSHELFLDAGTARSLPGLIRALLRRYESRLVRRASAVVTVNAAIAGALVERYAPRRMVVVHNCPPRWTPTRSEDPLRRAAAIPADSAVVLYHGNLAPGRGIEALLGALDGEGLERVQLVLLGPGAAREHYLRVGREARYGGRVHVLEPVAPSDL